MVSVAFLPIACVLFLSSITGVNSNTALDGVQGSMTAAKQTIDTLVRQFQSGGGGRNSANSFVAAITGLDAQIDNAAGTISEALSPLTFGLSEDVGGFLLGPIFQSITNGAEVLIGNLAGAPVDLAAGGLGSAVASLQTSLNSMISVGNKFHVNTVDMSRASQKISQVLKNKSANPHSHHHKRSDNPLYDGALSGIANSRQTVETLIRQFQSGGGHNTANSLVAFITGLDSQADNLAGTVATALSPLTGGVSMAIGNVLLGPVFQSITNGAEVLIGNLAGAPVDMIADATIGPAMKSLSQNINKLAETSKKYQVNVSGLQRVQSQIANFQKRRMHGGGHGGSGHKQHRDSYVS